MSKPIKIVIVDDHEIVIDGLKSILNPFYRQSFDQDGPAESRADNFPFQIVGIASNGEELIERISGLKELDVIVMDYYMKNKNGLDTALEIRKLRPAVKIVIFSMEESAAVVNEAFVSNLDGYVTKGEGRQRLMDAIKRVNKGERVFPPLKNAPNAYTPWIKPSAGSGKNILSKRELEVVCLIVSGQTTQQIADDLNIAFNTVEVHRNNIYRKLDINKLADLVRYALEHNLCK